MILTKEQKKFWNLLSKDYPSKSQRHCGNCKYGVGCFYELDKCVGLNTSLLSHLYLRKWKWIHGT